MTVQMIRIVESVLSERWMLGGGRSRVNCFGILGKCPRKAERRSGIARSPAPKRMAVGETYWVAIAVGLRFLFYGRWADGKRRWGARMLALGARRGD